MNKFAVFAVVFLVAILSLGCTTVSQSGQNAVNVISQIGKNNAVDVIEHPEKYDGQEITIQPSMIFFADRGFSWLTLKTSYGGESVYPGWYIITERNEEGKPVSMLVNYSKFYCIKCQITAIVKKMRGCNCQMDYCERSYAPPVETNVCTLNDTPKWSSALYSLGEELVTPIPVERCNRTSYEGFTSGRSYSVRYRCDPGSETPIYYLDVTKVVALDT